MKRRYLEILRGANAALALYCQEHVAVPVQFNDDDLADNRFLGAQFQAVQPLLDGDIQHFAEPVFQRELQLYRTHLLRVRKLLQVSQQLTIQQIEQLGIKRTHLDAARRWCEVFSEQF